MSERPTINPNSIRLGELPQADRKDIAEALRGSLGVDALMEKLRECMEASHRGAPDYRTRLSAVQLALAYMYGRPVERRLEARTTARQAGGPEERGGLNLERLASAPAAAEAIVEALLTQSPEARSAAARFLAAQSPADLVMEVERVGG